MKLLESQIPELLAEADKTGDTTDISDLNQVGVKKPQMTTESKMCPVLATTGTKDATHLNNQTTQSHRQKHEVLLNVN